MVETIAKGTFEWLITKMIGKEAFEEIRKKTRLDDFIEIRKQILF